MTTYQELMARADLLDNTAKRAGACGQVRSNKAAELRRQALAMSVEDAGKTFDVDTMAMDAVERYSNPGELVADPFGGLMTVPYMAVKMDRKGFGCELNPKYFHDGSYYMKDVDAQVGAPTLFDLS